MKIFASITLLICSICCFSQTSKDTIQCNDDSPYFNVDIMPSFKGGGIDSFKKYVVQELHKSPVASEIDICCEIVAQFIICQSGSLIKPTIIRGLHPKVDGELLTILVNSPKWEPGRHKNGEKVSVVYTLRIPVNFQQINNPRKWLKNTAANMPA